MSTPYTFPFSAFQALPPITPELMNQPDPRSRKQRLQDTLASAQESLQHAHAMYEAASLSLQTAQTQYRKAERNADAQARSLETALRSTPRMSDDDAVLEAVAPAIKAHAHADELRRGAFRARQRAEEDELEARSALDAARSAETDAGRNLEFFVETGIDLSRDGLDIYGF
ncbi:hypothetical protein Tdes44962_MAKER05065 [Teratosphaeria destructans]|uniref:Uncharacterized protein n=1 Tax=Teratosphaeria destructans TaxID=418781 RepID=A0A9W7VZB5_9PEZI|nr:hypothetical protein Tdes44962_MAKER05065 [Teratosphaeria destructans]